MRRLPTGVTIVTTVVEGLPYGFTANAFASVSAEPPIVLICVNRQAHSHPLIARSGVFCVNVLAHEQLEVARRFAGPQREDRFTDLRTRSEETGAPVIDGTLAWFDCRLSEEHPAGTHTIFLGAVAACDARAGAPLGYFDGDYRDFGVAIV
jgi:flavin reductase (DIM6/NTAB) family NADH-FMN oxidoreductase RutF